MEKIREALDKARLERASATEMPGAGQARRFGPATAATEVASGPGQLPRAERPARQSQPSAPFADNPETLERNRILAANASGPATTAFRQLRTQVLKRMRERDWRTLGIASARSSDGKTTIAANLAIAISADPRHTALLVDLDLRRPAIARVFGVEPALGIDDVLAGDACADAAFTHPASFTRLRLLPARQPVAMSSSVVAAPACLALVTELRERYLNRVVLFDMPPVLESDDAVTLSSLLDCLLVVVAEGRTARDDLSRTLTLLRDTPVVGTVLNRSIEAVGSESYG